MTDYSCDKCGMGVTGMKCSKCSKDLIHSHITKPNGDVVHVSKCPDDCGMIKSPMCCGQDMSCSS